MGAAIGIGLIVAVVIVLVGACLRRSVQKRTSGSADPADSSAYLNAAWIPGSSGAADCGHHGGFDGGAHGGGDCGAGGH